MAISKDELHQIQIPATVNEISELLRSCNPVPEMTMIVRKMAFEIDSLKAEIKYHESQAIRTW